MKRIFIFAFILAISITTLSINAAAETLPELFPYEEEHYKDIVLVDPDGNYVLYTIYSVSYQGTSVDGYNVNIYTNPSGETFLEIDRKGLNSTSDNYKYTYRVYRIEDGMWVRQSEGNQISVTQTVQFGPFTDIVYSDLDIYKDGTIFFPLPPKPLYQTVTEVGAQTLQSTAVPEVASTMMILTLCGVGLLALLMVLPLLGKIFSSYRS